MCTYEKLQIRDSFMFGKVMEDPENCEALLEALLLEKIEVIDCPQREKFIQMKKNGKGLYKYTFQKTCIEDGEIKLDDKATTIFFNTTADSEDIPKKTRNLFRYIMTEEATDEITTRLKESVEEARKREDWGNEYMLTVMHDTEVWNDGKAEGRVEGREEMRAELQPEIDALKALLLANNIPLPQK